MTSNDFTLLFAAFAGFVIAPAFFLWGVAYLVNRNKSGRSDPGVRSNIEPIDDARTHGTTEATHSVDQARSADDADVRHRRSHGLVGFMSPQPPEQMQDALLASDLLLRTNPT